MKKIVVYKGGTEQDLLLCTAPSALVKGKRYEVISQKFFDEGNAYELKNVEGYFDVKWFDDENEILMKKDKPVYFAKAVIYGDISNFLYTRFYLKKLVKEKYKMILTKPIRSVDHIYGCVYKLDTEDAVYITYVIERTVG